MRQITLFRLLILVFQLLAFSANSQTLSYYLYKDQYIPIETTETGCRIGETNIAKENIAELPLLLKHYQSKKVIFSGEITMSDLLYLGPILSEHGYEMYWINKDDEIKPISFQ